MAYNLAGNRVTNRAVKGAADAAENETVIEAANGAVIESRTLAANEAETWRSKMA